MRSLTLVYFSHNGVQEFFSANFRPTEMNGLGLGFGEVVIWVRVRVIICYTLPHHERLTSLNMRSDSKNIDQWIKEALTFHV